MDANDVSKWFDEYLAAFAACGRREREPDSMLDYYGVPIVFTSDRGTMALTSGDQVVGAVRPQVEEMRASGYDRSEILEREITVLNATSSLYRGAFSRRRRDGSEISRLSVTYLVTDRPVGRRISVLAVHH